MSEWVVIRGGLADNQSDHVRVIDIDFMEDSFIDIDTLEEAYEKLNDILEIPELAYLVKEVDTWIENTSQILGVKICPSCGTIRPLEDYPDWGHGKCEDCEVSPA